MPEFRKVARTEDIPPGKVRSFEVHYSRIVVCNVDGKFFALDDECTHDGAQISDGRLFKEQLVCRRHGARFNVKDGSVEAPPAIVSLETYEVKIEGDDIYVAVD